MGWFNVSNLELGAAGLVDLGSRVDDKALSLVGLGDTWLGTWAKTNNTTLAPQVYASQVEDDPSLSYSTTIERAAEHGASKEQLHTMALQAGVVAEEQGALDKAAKKTADQLMSGLGDLGDKARGGLMWGLIAAGVVVGGIVAFKLMR